MTKIAILTVKKRVEKYSDLKALPQDWQLTYLGLDKTEDQILAAAADAHFILADVIVPITAKLIDQMPNLKLIHSEGVGFDCIDLQAAQERGIYVCNNAALNSQPVAEQAILLMLAMLRRLAEGDALVRQGQQAFAKSSFILDGLKELNSCQVGLVGFGAIAQETAKILRAFGSKVVFYDPHNQNAKFGACYCPLEQLLTTSDIVSLHVPSTPQTQNLVDKNFLAQMKNSSILINTARGELLDNMALVEALENDTISGAALDTVAPEPVQTDNPLLNLSDNCRYKLLLSPHIGGTTHQVFYEMHQTVWSNMQLVAQGKPPTNIVNKL